MKAKREKRAKREKPEKQERAKLKFNWKIAIPLLVIVVAAAVVCVILFLRGGEGGKGKTPKLPVAYAVGEAEIPAMTAGKDEKVTWTQDAEGVYTYEGFSDNAAAAEDYAQELLDSAMGFEVVDDGYVKQEMPEFTETSGTVSLARDSAEEGKLYSVVIEWTEENCVVKLDIPEGAITEPKQPSEGSTLSEKLEHFESLPPSVLGLEGSSMDEYEIYATNGTVIVDDYVCLQLNVYSKQNPVETNDPCGVYLMSSDELHLYRLDRQTGEVTELDIP